ACRIGLSLEPHTHRRLAGATRRIPSCADPLAVRSRLLMYRRRKNDAAIGKTKAGREHHARDPADGRDGDKWAAVGERSESALLGGRLQTERSAATIKGCGLRTCLSRHGIPSVRENL